MCLDSMKSYSQSIDGKSVQGNKKMETQITKAKINPNVILRNRKGITPTGRYPMTYEFAENLMSVLNCPTDYLNKEGQRIKNDYFKGRKVEKQAMPEVFQPTAIQLLTSVVNRLKELDAEEANVIASNLLSIRDSIENTLPEGV